VTYNWVKRSIFWELPYWKTGILRHNLDVMHIEKNMFENIFNTVMDMKGKKRDNMEARMDIPLFCHHKNIELVYDESYVAKPNVNFTLDNNAQLIICQWLKSLCFPNEHASNISRLVNLKDYILYRIKSHGYQVFIQTPIPLAYRDLLSKWKWDTLTKSSHFSRDICSNKLYTQYIKRLEIEYCPDNMQT